MNKLFINVFHEDDLSELEMQEILAGVSCSFACMCNAGKLCFCDTATAKYSCNCNVETSKNSCVEDICTSNG